VTAGDRAQLEAWLFTPNVANEPVVLLLHGVGDTRTGMTIHAEYLLRAGFTVLMPDLRGHGASGGVMTTYGLREADDVRRWVDWMEGALPGSHVYGMGESLGAAILLQSLPRVPEFRAVVAECPFATFAEVANDRMSQASGLWRPLFWPVVRAGFLYSQLRYGLNFYQASPLAAVRNTQVPILLIHGTRDVNIYPQHSRELKAANPAIELWEVPGAIHVGAFAAGQDVFVDRVVGWFEAH